MYNALIGVAGGKVVCIDTYPDFRIDPDHVAAAITPHTKAIIVNSPANPTGVVSSEEEVRALAELAAQQNIVLISARFTAPSVTIDRLSRPPASIRKRWSWTASARATR